MQMMGLPLISLTAPAILNIKRQEYHHEEHEGHEELKDEPLDTALLLGDIEIHQ